MTWQALAMPTEFAVKRIQPSLLPPSCETNGGGGALPRRRSAWPWEDHGRGRRGETASGWYIGGGQRKGCSAWKDSEPGVRCAANKYRASYHVHHSGDSPRQRSTKA